MLSCDQCEKRGCVAALDAGYAAGCPTLDAAHEQAREVYACDDRMLAVTSHVATRDGYGWATRVEEIMLFAARSGYRSIGVAFCITLAKEARAFCEVLRANGFFVHSVLCKVGALPRDLLGEPLVCDTKPGMARALCNPVGQAKLLNQAGVDLNVVVGLCVGHDSLFFKHADAPCTYLAVKDRVCAHDPLAPLRAKDGVSPRIRVLDLPPALDTQVQCLVDASLPAAAAPAGAGRREVSNHAC